MKGKAKIILTDVRDGSQKIIHEENMFTDALDSLYSGNPYGLNSRAIYRDTSTAYTGNTMGNFYPRITLGGILCFPNALEEAHDHIYEDLSHQPTAYASNDAYSGENIKRGSFNSYESGQITNGFRFVWDFATNQGNGQIGALALTHARAGMNYFDDITTAIDAGSFNMGSYETVTSGNGIRCAGYPSGAWFVLAHNEDEALVGFLDGSVRHARIRANKVSVFDFLDFSNPTTVDRTFKVVEGKSFSTNDRYVSAGATFYKINTVSATTITWDWYNINYEFLGSGTWEMSGIDLNTSNGICSCVSDGYLYWPARVEAVGTYRINLSNLADVTELTLKPSWPYADIGAGWVMNPYGFASGGAGVSKRTDQSIIPPFTRHGVWLTMLRKCGDYSYIGMNMSNFLLTPYLATINNLENPVTKNAGQTMKIIYEVTEN